MNDRVTRQIETMKQGYILDPNRILADYRKEIAEIRGYHGRELLELLQNAVDELGGTNDRSVSVVLRDNVLTISNNGSLFTFEGFISLMYSNLSPKHNKNEYIGNKGTGFRSILNWADRIRIYSGDLSVEFSDDYAQETLTELHENAGVAEFCASHDEVNLATLVAPRLISPLHNKKYDTVIEVELKVNVVDKVLGQLRQLNSKTILFLEKLEKLIVEYNGDVLLFQKDPSERDNGVCDVTITTKKNDEIIERDEWSVLSREGEFEKRKYGVMVAYKEDMSAVPDVLYSYFKTKVQFPIHALVHATFDLNAERNHLSETEANKHILRVVCDTLVELALRTTSESVNYAPLSLLATIRDFPGELNWDDFNISEYYLEAVAANCVFPTVNGKYVSFDEKPKFYYSNIADFLCGTAFETLMPSTENIEIRNLLKAISKHKKLGTRYPYNEITTGINAALPSLQIRERAALWLAFVNEYKNEISTDHKPHFVIDSNGKAVIDGQQVFLPAENINFSSPPDFTKIVFMHKDLVAALRDMQGKDSSLRILATELSKFDVREYNLVNIVNAVISRLRNRTHQASKKTRGCYEETIEWLWKLWKAGVLKNEMPTMTTVPLMNRNGEAKNANELYFGQEFGNDVTEYILTSRNDLFVALPNETLVYKNGLFAMLKKEPVSMRRTFLKQLDKYKSFAFNPPNSVHYDWREMFVQQFGDIIATASDDSADAAWKVNRDVFIQDKDIAIVNDLLVDAEMESLLYFGDFDALDEAYNTRKTDLDNAQAQESKTLSATSATPVPIKRIDVSAPSATSSKNGHTPRTGSRMAGMKRERNISDWGAFAERFVYDQMKSAFQNVVWVSENAKKEGVNPDGIGGLGYDLKYTNEDGETIFVEIKSTSGTGIAFVITENELNFAETHPRHYEVILVTDVMDDDERKIYRLENLFNYADGEGRYSNSRFSISGDNYTVRCQIEVTADD